MHATRLHMTKRRTLLELLLLSDFGRLQPDRARVPGAARLEPTVQPVEKSGVNSAERSEAAWSGTPFYAERSDA
jgi:hypothetical protein